MRGAAHAIAAAASSCVSVVRRPRRTSGVTQAKVNGKCMAAGVMQRQRRPLQKIPAKRSPSARVDLKVKAVKSEV